MTFMHHVSCSIGVQIKKCVTLTDISELSLHLLSSIPSKSSESLHKHAYKHAYTQCRQIESAVDVNMEMPVLIRSLK